MVLSHKELEQSQRKLLDMHLDRPYALSDTLLTPAKH